MQWLMATALALVVLIGLIASPSTLLSRWKAAGEASLAEASGVPDKPVQDWTVQQLGESSCRLSSTDPESVTVYFSAYLPGPSWQTRLVRTVRMPTRTHRRYTLRFEAKADAPRPMSVAVGEPGRAGGSLGLREIVGLTTDWMPFQFSFPVRYDCDAPQIQFDIGASPATVSIRAVALTEDDGE